MCKRMFAFLVLGLLSVFLISGCGSESPTGPSGSKGQGSVLVSPLAVAVVPNGIEMISITATDADGNPDTCTVSCRDLSVATFIQSGSLVEVKGQSYGLTKLVITNRGGLTREVPIQVYNCKILDTGELLVTFVDQFQWRWDDSGSGGIYDGAFYQPVTSDGWRSVGSLGVNNYGGVNGLYSIMVVKPDVDANTTFPPISEPVDYQLIYNDRCSGATDDGSFWLPVPPAGYKAIGVVAQSGWNKPPLSDIVCIREDLVVPGRAGAFVWNDDETGACMNFGGWRIDPPMAGPHEGAYLGSGTFVAWSLWSPPTAHDAMNVLNVELPMLAQAPYQSYVPRLTDYEKPPDETVPMMAKAMLVPYTILADELYAGNPAWRWTNSPFYRLERYVFYKLLYHNYNQTSVEQENSVEIVSGVTVEESNRYWTETGISITAESGVSLGVFSGSVSATVSTSFGYETMTSVAQLQEKHVVSTIKTPATKAAALWQQYNRYVLKRHNGTNLEIVSAWEFGIDSYVTDEYPH
jgi:hypothetical protein